MNIPADLKYTKNDEWVRVEGDSCVIGVTDYAQDALSDVVYAEVSPGVGDSISKGDSFGTIESVKAAADVYTPMSGTVTAVNDLLDETPEVINSDPYGNAWMIRLEMSNSAELDSLMDSSAYQAYVETRE
jgi:glycine cleavage system H protein